MPTDPINRLTLVLGGARSGKSSFAEALIMQAPAPWTYLATAQALDDEMASRIASHQERRGPEWQTVDVPLELVEAIEDAGERPLLIDCLTLWLTNMMLDDRDLTEETGRLLHALGSVPGPCVLVSNEVGLGIVPETPLGRAFRDAQGMLNQRIAAIAERVVLMTAGIPLTVKPQITGGPR